MLVFAVETSCDETSVCIMKSNKNILSHIIYSQEIHKKHGGSYKYTKFDKERNIVVILIRSIFYFTFQILINLHLFELKLFTCGVIDIAAGLNVSFEKLTSSCSVLFEHILDTISCIEINAD